MYEECLLRGWGKNCSSAFSSWCASGTKQYTQSLLILDEGAGDAWWGRTRFGCNVLFISQNYQRRIPGWIVDNFCIRMINMQCILYVKTNGVCPYHQIKSCQLLFTFYSIISFSYIYIYIYIYMTTVLLISSVTTSFITCPLPSSSPPLNCRRSQVSLQANCDRFCHRIGRTVQFCLQWHYLGAR